MNSSEKKRETYSSIGPKIGGKNHSESYNYREMLPRDMCEPNPLTRVDKANYFPNTSLRICFDNAGI